MIRLFRQLLGKSIREAKADAMAERGRIESLKCEKELRAKRIAIEQLVAQLQKDVTACH